MIQHLLIETNEVSHQAAAAGAQASKSDGLAGLFAALLQSLQGSVDGQAVEEGGAAGTEAELAKGQATETPVSGVDDTAELASLLAGLAASAQGLETPINKGATAGTVNGALESAKSATGAALPGRTGVSVAASLASAIAGAVSTVEVVAETNAGGDPAVSGPRAAPSAALAHVVAADAPPVAGSVVDDSVIAAQVEVAPKAAIAKVAEAVGVKPEAITVAAAASESSAGAEASIAVSAVRSGSRVTRESPDSVVPIAATTADDAAEGTAQVKATAPSGAESAMAESDAEGGSPEPRVAPSESRAALPVNPRAETVPLVVSREMLASLDTPAAETVRAELTTQGKASAPTVEGAALPVDAKAPAELPEVRVQRVGDLVVQSIRQSGNGGERTIRIQLVPESLGEMRITIRASGDEVNVLMAVKHAAARETLELHTHALRETLAAEGFDPGKVSVQVSTGSDSGAGGFGRFGEAAGQAGRTGHAISRSYPEHAGSDEQAHATRRFSSSTLDVLA